jgi:hypothetical protein
LSAGTRASDRVAAADGLARETTGRNAFASAGLAAKQIVRA